MSSNGRLQYRKDVWDTLDVTETMTKAEAQFSKISKTITYQRGRHSGTLHQRPTRSKVAARATCYCPVAVWLGH